MKKTLRTLSTALALASLSAAYSIDFGALLSNDSNLTGNKYAKLMLDQSDTASAWIKVPLGKDAYFTTEGMYRFEKKWIDLFDVEENAKSADDESCVDLSLAKFQLQKELPSGLFTLSAGRFATADTTSVIYAQAGDGVALTYAIPGLQLSAYGAYTGLLNTRTVSILNEDGYADEEPSKKYDFAAKYAVAALTASATGFIGSQTASIQALGAFRLEDESFNRLYATLAFSGPVLPRVYYTASSTLALRTYDGENELSNLTKASLTLFAEPKSLSLSAAAVYASGEQGPFKAFEGVTSQTAVRALNGRTEYTGLIKAGLAASAKPCRTLLTALGADLIFDAADTAVGYEGFQWQLSASWQLVSDVSLSLLTYQYYDVDDDDRNKSCIDISCAIAF